MLNRADEIGNAATPLLDLIGSPDDLKRIPIHDLPALAAEIRQELLTIVTQNGGHLGASLGAVELAIALHWVFASPRDKIVWDVGHQAYAHKLLTGRRSRFTTLRQESGISGFLSRDESEHDAFGAGHASTSISAALGMAVAFSQGPDPERRVAAVIGDGALTGGMAFEALNNAGALELPFLVVLNDNEMSIAPNVGALSHYLNRVRTDPRYNRAKDEIARITERLPQGDFLVELGKRWKDSVKEFIYHSMIWEELGFTYMGPVDGHDLRGLIESLRQAKMVDGPVFLHVVTEKGRGFAAAKTDRERGHAVSAPTPEGAPPSPPKYQDVFADTVIKLANDDPRVVAITAAMPTGTSLARFQAVHPERFFDVGIAEQHAVTFAAGLAAEGMRPVVGIYSTFLQRAYDQIVHDVCLQRLPVTFAIDRAGFAGDDGRTHHGIFDLSYLRCLPNMTIMAPRDENELRHMLATAVQDIDGPVAVRYPRGSGVGVDMAEPLQSLRVGESEVLRNGDDVAIFALGSMVRPAERAADMLLAEGIHASVINARFVKPLDKDLIEQMAAATGALVTVEENAKAGGFGSAVLEALEERQIAVSIRVLGVPDRVYEQASQGRLREIAGLTPGDIAAAARQAFLEKSRFDAHARVAAAHRVR